MAAITAITAISENKTEASIIDVSELDKIRNISIIGNVDSGKSSLTDTLCKIAGLVSEENAGKARITDIGKREKEKGVTIKSTGVSFKTSEISVNLIDSPGHADFNSEVSAALRLTDGVLLLVDCAEGICVQTETVLRQALAEQVKPILVINKMDRLFGELNLNAEEAYLKLSKIVESINVLIQTFLPDRGWEVSPEKGNVIFASGYMGWGFSLKSCAEAYCKKNPSFSEEKLISLLWGDNYYNSTTKKFITTGKSKDSKDKADCKRVFNHLIYQPLYNIYNFIQENNLSGLATILEKYDVKLSKTDFETAEMKDKKKLFKNVMKKVMPLEHALMYGINHHLPSPKAAQVYRVNTLYDGPLDDEAANGIRNCDPDGPLMIYISKMLDFDDSGRFFAFGRILSGTIQSGQKVTILGADYVHGGKNDIYINKSVPQVGLAIGKDFVQVSKAVCGNTVALAGIEKYLVKTGTITSISDSPYPIKTMKLMVAPVVRVAVQVKHAGDLPKLNKCLVKLKKTDGSVNCYQTEDGEMIIAGAGEYHIENLIENLQDFMGESEFIISKPSVPYRESISATSKSCLAKSPNGHNRIWIVAEPLDLELVADIEEKKVDFNDMKTFSKYLVEKYKWDANDAKRVLALGPISQECNILVDCTRGIAYMSEIKDHVISAFHNLTDKGVMCGEQMYGVRFNIVDAMLHADSIHRGMGQCEPAARRAMSAAFLSAEPRLYEPIYEVQIAIPDTMSGKIYSALSSKRGTVTNEIRQEGTGRTTIIGHLPVLESFGFDNYIRGETGGQAFSSFIFNHWKALAADPLDPDSKPNKLITELRVKRNKKEEIPDVGEFLDKL